MSLSVTDVSLNKQTPVGIQPDPKHAPVVMKKLKSTTVVPSECRQPKGSNEVKAEIPQVLEGNEKEKKSPSQNENPNESKREHSKIENVKSKIVEVKTDKQKTEDTKSKISTGVTAKLTKSPECKMIPIINKSDTQKPSNVAVPRKCPPLSTPLLSERPLVLTTHLVPSLPISLFEVLVEALEVATGKPVVLVYEPRSHRPVAKEVTDIAILPASEEWEDGELLPVTFCFEHRLNKNNSPCIYVDVIVATDRASHVEDITDLRGHRCSLPDRRKKNGAAALLFNYLYTRGENPTFFGNTLDADTQIATLQMVAGKQAEIGILESPVIKCHKDVLPGIESVQILTSLGPLPPYRIMVKKTLPDVQKKQITAYLLNIVQDSEWMDRFTPFGITSFVKNSAKFYDLNDVKSVVTSVPYY
ncbi:uncharacterized protein LOC143146293 [Ptiloglossa arizonensis]|uniref:uncharacterized protein LOC143146293 n=1 Tax=Ptiloglossa arizonensis TaxID=3350558 RepID=UPI003FA04470